MCCTIKNIVNFRSHFLFIGNKWVTSMATWELRNPQCNLIRAEESDLGIVYKTRECCPLVGCRRVQDKKKRTKAERQILYCDS